MKMKLWIPQKKNSFPLFNREISRFYPYNTMLLGKDSTKSIVIDSVEKIKIEWRDCWNLPHSFYLKVRGKYEFQYVFKATTGNKSFYFVGVEEMDRDDSSSMYTINKFISKSFVKEKIKEEKANNEKK
ncbi:MAG TPA: hypothetical protein GXZ90_01985 [Clostridiales bacterium]|nr:hypothetical protein [Clostridiales bacterium]